MDENKSIPDFNSYEEMANFWDTHSLADYWDQTEPAEFEFSAKKNINSAQTTANHSGLCHVFGTKKKSHNSHK